MKNNTDSIKGFFTGGIIGVLGGLVGLGGAEFRLPALIYFFRLNALSAIILNKAMSLVVVGFALPFRLTTTPASMLLDNTGIIFTILFGSVIGAWFGVGFALKIKSHTLYKIISFLLLFIAVILFFEHNSLHPSDLLFHNDILNMVVGVVLGIIIGAIAAILGVAGGELYIPTIILIYGVDIKLAGSLSLAISLPTMLVAFFRYSRDDSFKILYTMKLFTFIFAIGSIIGAYIGSLFLGMISPDLLIPVLCIILLISSYKMYRHKEAI
ncbi:sulfite exporter TauE/SafE family protein [bacterium]|nr:sulfite exporter TauE/SafE family protein [bacterium]MBU1883177.1 sulfite exporter TauE/SafE family protein [bacterium]